MMTPNQLNKPIPRVLIVDDVPENLDVLVEHLQRENIELSVALSGKEGIALARETNPDLILLDVMMPELDGYDTCQLLKKDPLTEEIPIIFLTAKSDEANIEKGLSIGAVDYISKPFSIPILKARLFNQLTLKRKSDMLKQLALTDDLSRIANRRCFDEVFERELSRAKRSELPLSVLMIDVDNFKDFNDHYGHCEGDRCLRQIASALSQALHRPADFLARYGGEEFVALLPETELDGAKCLAQNMCRAVTQLIIPHEYSTAAESVSVSIGVASLAQKANASTTVLLKLADYALYQAKYLGRNQVCVYQP